VPRSILLVDDDPAVLRLLERYFQRGEWATFSASSGEEALRVWDRERPDLVVLDLGLPGLSGLHVLDLLAVRGAAVLILTGRAEVQVAVDAMQAGAEGFLTKPIDLEHLGAAAARAVEKVELRRENRLLAERLAREGGSTLGTSPGMRDIERQVALLAGSPDTTALLLGESGTGKSWVAELVHASSPRSGARFVEINCAGLSATFLDSELFGHEKGAFTDAREMKRGLFEVADRGTIFLDEIGDLAPELQPKLLRVLETRRFRRLGGTRELQVDVRVLAATNRDLRAEVAAGRFREDLYYRLSVFPITIPPLRTRSGADVQELLERFLSELSPRHPGSPRDLSPRALDLLLAHRWPGNVRELRNTVERALVLARGADAILPEHLPEVVRAAPSRPAPEEGGIAPLAEMERLHIERALRESGGNRTLAARWLGISRSTLYVKIREHGLDAS
jgi:two-component system, NtrC family, response regulator HydG